MGKLFLEEKSIVARRSLWVNYFRKSNVANRSLWVDYFRKFNVARRLLWIDYAENKTMLLASYL